MRIFELHFNPRLSSPSLKKGETPDLIFDSFCYEPENIYEKRLGSLFLVGELKNVLPQNLKFLDNLSNFLKKEYYSTPIKFSPETSLKESLRKANDFLEGIAKNGDVSWLGNLNLAVFSLTPYRKDSWTVNFTKVGMVKILLIRKGQIIDIGKNLELSEIEPYPLKIFGNIVSGKLAENDILLVLTKDIFSVFADSTAKFGGGLSSKTLQKASKSRRSSQPGNLIEKIAEMAPFDEKKLKEILKTEEKELLKNSGICFLCILTKESWSKEKKPKTFTFQKEAERFSLLQVFYPVVKEINLFFTRRCARVINGFKILKLRFSKVLTKLKEAAKKLLKFKKPEIKISLRKPRRNIFDILRGKPEIKFSENLKKNIVLVSFLIFFLLLGFFIFKREEEAKLKKYQITLTTVRENISQADNFLFLKGEEKAFTILKEAWQELLPLTKKKSAIQKEAISLKDALEGKLEKASNLEKIAEPELFFEFDRKEFIPQKMAHFEGSHYFFSSFADNVYELTKKAGKSVLQTNQKFNEAAPTENSLLFFEKPNLIFLMKNDQFGEQLSLKSPYPDFDPKDLATYQSNLYFLDGKNGEIIKYPGPISAGKDNPQLWLKKDTKKATDAKSVAVNGNVWVLNNDNTIFRYFGGDFQNSLNFDFFPFPKDLSKIFSQSEFLYLLEPAQKRLIVLTKTGGIIKQFQSEKFDNLKDFAVSENGRTIWLLNGTKVYQIKF